MKHYLTRAQMRELAEIGFDTRQLATHECNEDGITYFSLSIGDLIEMLPTHIPSDMGYYIGLNMYMPEDEKMWIVGYTRSIRCSSDKLIDALFNLVVELNQ